MLLLRKPELLILLIMTLVWICVFLYLAFDRSLTETNFHEYFIKNREMYRNLDRKLWKSLTDKKMKAYHKELLFEKLRQMSPRKANLEDNKVDINFGVQLKAKENGKDYKIKRHKIVTRKVRTLRMKTKKDRKHLAAKKKHNRIKTTSDYVSKPVAGKYPATGSRTTAELHTSLVKISSYSLKTRLAGNPNNTLLWAPSLSSLSGTKTDIERSTVELKSKTKSGHYSHVRATTASNRFNPRDSLPSNNSSTIIAATLTSVVKPRYLEERNDKFIDVSNKTITIRHDKIPEQQKHTLAAATMGYPSEGSLRSNISSIKLRSQLNKSGQSRPGSKASIPQTQKLNTKPNLEVKPTSKGEKFEAFDRVNTRGPSGRTDLATDLPPFRTPAPVTLTTTENPEPSHLDIQAKLQSKDPHDFSKERNNTTPALNETEKRGESSVIRNNKVEDNKLPIEIRNKLPGGIADHDIVSNINNAKDTFTQSMQMTVKEDRKTSLENLRKAFINESQPPKWSYLGKSIVGPSSNSVLNSKSTKGRQLAELTSITTISSSYLLKQEYTLTRKQRTQSEIKEHSSEERVKFEKQSNRFPVKTLESSEVTSTEILDAERVILLNNEKTIIKDNEVRSLRGEKQQNSLLRRLIE